MKLIGKAIGILTDNVTGEKTVAFDESNHIQDTFLRKRTVGWDFGDSIGNNILIIHGDQSPVSQRRDWDEMPSQTVIGTNIAGVTSPEYTWYDTNDSVHVKQVAQRFEAPASEDRTIHVIGLFYTGVKIDTAVTLTVPCVQTTTQTLDVFYRIQVAYEEDYWDTDWPHDSIIPTPLELEHWAKWLMAWSPIPVDNSLQRGNWADKLNPRRLKDSLGGTYNDLSLDDINLVNTSEYFHAGKKWTLPITNSIGKFVALSYFRNTNTADLMHAQHILKDVANSSPVQNTFGHSVNALVPFYDAGTTQGGLGTMVINGSAWTNPDFPKLLRLNVTNTGILGVGSYKFQIRNALGFDANSYLNMPQELIGYHYANKHLTDKFPIIRGNNDVIIDEYESHKITPILRYDEKTILAGWIDEIMLSDVPSQEGTRIAVDTVPSMSAVNISQFCKDESTGDIYVACRTNGAFKISADLTTVTRMYSATVGLTGVTGCYGINVTATGRVWAYFGGGAGAFGLYYSDDSGTNWLKPAFSHTAIDADPTLVVQVIVDPSHIDDQIAVIYGDAPLTDKRDLLIAWWDKAATIAVGGVAVQGPIVMQVADYPGVINTNQQPGSSFWSDFNVPVTLMKVLRCSPNDGFWLTSLRRLASNSQFGYVCKFTFGTATTTDIPSTDLKGNNWQNGDWGVDENGSDAFFYLCQDSQDDGLLWGNYIKVQVMLRKNLTYDFHSYQNPNDHLSFELYEVVYLGIGIHLCVRYPLWQDGTPTKGLTHGGMGIVCALPNGIDENTDVTGHIYDNELYPEYGWNVDHWEKGHVGSKPMHAGAEELIDGITISFDDNLGADGWEDTDFYTTVIINGIVADGSTTYEQNLEIYVKPTKLCSDFENSILPATTRTPGHFEDFIPTVTEDWQDNVDVNFGNGTVSRVPGINYDGWNAKARSILPAIESYSSNLSSITRLSFNDMTDVQGYVEWYFYGSSFMSTQPYQHAAGLSNAAKVGGPLTNSTIMYGIVADSGDPIVNEAVKFSVIESGAVKFVTPDLFIKYNNDTKVRIIIKTDGAVIYEIFDTMYGWLQLYASPPGTATIEDLYFEYTSSIYDSGLQDIKYASHIAPDHYLFLGNGVDNGLFGNKFRFIDPVRINLTIDGLPAQNIGVDNTDTVLATGEYSVFPYHGVIRYSPDDVGKSIAGNFLYISDEV